MDFQNKLIMIRFSLYHHANTLGATEKKMVADSPPALVNYILTAPVIATSPESPIAYGFAQPIFWYMLNNGN
jgi:hypothetical protein